MRHNWKYSGSPAGNRLSRRNTFDTTINGNDNRYSNSNGYGYGKGKGKGKGNGVLKRIMGMSKHVSMQETHIKTQQRLITSLWKSQQQCAERSLHCSKRIVTRLYTHSLASASFLRWRFAIIQQQALRKQRVRALARLSCGYERKVKQHSLYLWRLQSRLLLGEECREHLKLSLKRAEEMARNSEAKSTQQYDAMQLSLAEITAATATIQKNQQEMKVLCQRQKRSEHLLTAFLTTRHRKRKLRRLFATWVSHYLSVSVVLRRQRLLRRAHARMSSRHVAKVFAVLVANTATRKRVRRIVQRVVKRVMHFALHRAFTALRNHWKRWVNISGHVTRYVLRVKHKLLSAAFRGWDRGVTLLRRRRKVLKYIYTRWRYHNLSLAFLLLVDLTQQHKSYLQLAFAKLKRACHFQQWQWQRQRQRRLALRVVTRMRRGVMLAALLQWRQHVTVIVMVRQRRCKEVQCLSRYLSQRHHSLQLSRAFKKFKASIKSMMKQRKVLRKLFWRRNHCLRLACGFRCWKEKKYISDCSSCSKHFHVKEISCSKFASRGCSSEIR